MSTSTVSNHIFSVDSNWGTSQFRPATENTGSNGQPATNHWSLFLEIDSARSVRVDVAPGDPHSPGMVILEMKNYNVSTSSVRDVYSQVPAGTTVETILQLIIDKRRDRYVFAPVGEGCRYWMWTFAWDMVEAELWPVDVAQRASNALQHYWRYPVGSGYEARVMAQGKFL